MKKMEELRIVFMGTPEFAVAALDKLVKAGCSIVGVVTAPDKAAGRGMQLQQSAVKQYANEQGLFVLQPEKLKSPDFLEQLKKLEADLQIVVAFRMLPELVWNMPPMGTVNLHGSLLPQYRGAAPINWAIINGEKFTGVTTFKLQQAIDTGDILLTSSIPIGEQETAGELHDKMKEIGADLLLQTIKGLAEGNLTETPQMESTEPKDLKIAPKIFTASCQIDWNKSITEIYNLIRGLSPYPAAFTFLEDKKVKIYKSERINTLPNIAAGEWLTDKKTFLHFAGIDGYIAILELQLEGKKKMPIGDFLRGYRWA
jgi:methionyl-tRNA formyltransferase